MHLTMIIISFFQSNVALSPVGLIRYNNDIVD